MKPYSDKWLATTYAMMGKTLNPSQQAIADWFTTTDSRFVLILGGERAGKSWLASVLAVMCMNLDKKGEYWVVGPDYQQARPEFLYIYNAFKDGVNGVSFVKEESTSMPTNIASPWSFETIWGQVWRTRSASDIQKLASFSVSGVIMAESAQHIYESYLKLQGRVMETKGFLILSGTLERGLPWYGDLYTRWQGDNDLGARSFSLPTWSNTAIFPGGEEEVRKNTPDYPEDLFMERFGAVPARRQGLVIPEFDFQRHVKFLTVDEKLPVELAADPAQHCYPVLFVQHIGLLTHVLDCVYARGKIAQEVIPEVMGHPLFKYVDKANAGVMDNAGKQHHANYSQMELWQSIGGCTFRAAYHPLDETIQTVRMRLGSNNPTHSPLIYFNSSLTNGKTPDGLATGLLAEFELWSWPDRGPGRNIPITPIDRNNDGIKALGYKLLDRYGTNIERKVQTRGRRRDYFI